MKIFVLLILAFAYAQRASFNQNVTAADALDSDHEDSAAFDSASAYRAVLTSKGATKINSTVKRLVAEEVARLNNAANVALSKKILAGEYVSYAEYFSDYRTFEEIRAFLWRLTSLNPDLVKFVPSIGKTILGEDIFMLRITSSNGKPKRKIFLQGQIHAREWISAATVQYLCVELIELYKAQNARIVTLLDNVEFLVVPVLNVDGFKFSWSSDRFWRKNRRQNAKNKGNSPKGVGVDLNRNYGDGLWGQRTKSKHVTSNTYPGTGPFSEPETQAVKNLLESENNLIAATDFHSATQAVLYTTPLQQHKSNVLASIQAMIDTVKGVSGRTYEVVFRDDKKSYGGYSERFFYTLAKKDFDGRRYRVYGNLVELTKTRQKIARFVLPPELIVDVGQEWINGIVAMAEYIQKNMLYM